MIVHPDLQPILTAIIVLIVTILSGIVVLYLIKEKNLVFNQKEN